jgi:hypothetical protein
MARAGRKRKINVERYPSGEAKTDYTMSPTLSKRLMLASAAKLADEHWGSVVGRYYLTGQFDLAQYRAARRLGELVEAYDRTMQGPKPPSQVTGERIKGAEIDPISEAGEAEAERHKSVAEQVQKIRSLLGCRKLYEDTRRLCYGLGELPDNYERFLNIRHALGTLVIYWKIDTKN